MGTHSNTLHYSDIHTDLTEGQLVSDLKLFWGSGAMPRRSVEFVISVSRTYIFRHYERSLNYIDKSYMYDDIADVYIEAVRRLEMLEDYISNNKIEAVRGLFFNVIKYSVLTVARDKNKLIVVNVDDLDLTASLVNYSNNMTTEIEADKDGMLSVPLQSIPLTVGTYLELNYKLKGVFGRYCSIAEINGMVAKVKQQLGTELIVQNTGKKSIHVAIYTLEGGKLFKDYKQLPII